MAEVKRITEAQLADILKGFRLAVRTEEGGLVNGEIHVPGNVALHVFRRVSAAHEDAPERCPWCRGAPFVRTGDCTCAVPCGADHCCPDGTGNFAVAPDADPELAAMAALLPALPAIHKLSYDARKRVLAWADSRVNDGNAPF